MFLDQVTLTLAAGKGGNGVVAWRRERYLPKGGPTGGNGGRGGDVFLKTNPRLFSLEKFLHQKRLSAEDGAQGGPNARTGKSGEDLALEVPCGTLVRDAKSGAVLEDLTQEGQTWLVCCGGKGGKGNRNFRSSTNRAPNKATPGKPGQERTLQLELKLIADVGLVGLPNAGKSTLLHSLSHVPVKIADYPFTTLSPNLGHIEFDDYRRLFIADIPGIIEGAHDNRGLGLEFLRHIERTRLLLYVLDGAGQEGSSPLEDYCMLREELASYNPELLKRPAVVVLNKCDLLEKKEPPQNFHSEGVEGVFPISAKTGEGIELLLDALKEHARY